MTDEKEEEKKVADRSSCCFLYAYENGQHMEESSHN